MKNGSPRLLLEFHAAMRFLADQPAPARINNRCGRTMNRHIFFSESANKRVSEEHIRVYEDAKATGHSLIDLCLEYTWLTLDMT